MDPVDKNLLDIIQSDFPITSRPYRDIGDCLGITEEDALARVRKLREKGIIRRLGANFQSSRVGFVSSLCAAKIPAEKIEEFVAIVNSHPGVTHNYERDHEYNIWFTLITPTLEARREILAEIEKRCGEPILDLPATRLFKIKVDFSMSDDPS